MRRDMIQALEMRTTVSLLETRDPLEYAYLIECVSDILDMNCYINIYDRISTFSESSTGPSLAQQAS